MRRWDRRLAVAIAVGLLAACGDDDEPVRAAAQAEREDGPAAPAQVTVTCTADTTTVDHPAVAASGDGVHLTVVDDSGRELEVRAELLRDAEERDSAAGPVEARDGEHVLALPPGPYLFLCSESDGPEHMLEPSETDEAVELEVLDPEGTWVPGVLDCGDGMMQRSIRDYVAGTEGEPGDPRELATKHLTDRLGSDGEVRHAGYPEPREDGIVYVFERDGRTRAITSAGRAGGGWIFASEEVCADDL